MKKVAILGSTGSIGTQALEVIKMLENEFEVVALAAGNNIDLIQKQVEEFSPKFVSVKNSDNAKILKQKFSDKKILVDGSYQKR